MTKIFTSWSGEKSNKVALALKEWIPDIIHNVELWVSDQDILAGSKWNDELNIELEQNYLGVICLTSENLEKPWILFEAGSLAKSMAISKVIPYRLDISAAEVKPPLSQFQGVDASKSGTFKLLESINQTIENPISKQRLERLFEKFWIDLEFKLSKIKEISPKGKGSNRNEKDILEEVLIIVRNLENPSPIWKSESNSTNFKNKWMVRYIFEKVRNKSISELELEKEQAYGTYDFNGNQRAFESYKFLELWIELMKKEEKSVYRKDSND